MTSEALFYSTLWIFRRTKMVRLFRRGSLVSGGGGTPTPTSTPAPTPTSVPSPTPRILRLPLRRRLPRPLLQLYRTEDLRRGRLPGRSHLRAAIKWSITRMCIAGSIAPTSVAIQVALIASGRPLPFQLTSPKLPLPTGGILILIRRPTNAMITSVVV
jgi:hypothetical protein